MSVTALPEQLADAAREFASRRHELLIDAEWVPAADGRTFETLDPSTGRPITQIAHAGGEDVDRAVKAARKALEEGKWRTAPAAQRATLMNRLADLVEQNADPLAELESLDNGKPVKLARIVDVNQMIAWLRHFAGWTERIHGDVIPVRQPDMHCYTRKEPVGVCGQIIPWNFPMMMAAWKLGPALAAGCTVVLKPAEQTPLTALRIGELALQAGIPAGVLNVLTGEGDTGAALVDHHGVDKIAFTGSTEVGREIGANAGRALKRVTLELGGKSPNIILPDADLDAAIAGSFMGIYFNTGQACNAGSRLFVHKDQFDQVVGALAERAGSSRVGPGLDPRPSSARSSPRSSVSGSSPTSRRAATRAPSSSPAASPRTRTAGTSSRRRCSPRRATTSGSRVRRSSGRCWSRSRTSRWRRSPPAPTTPSTAWRPASGPATSATPTGWQHC